MRRTKKKKTTKKKTATKAAPEKRMPTPDEFDAWASLHKEEAPGGCSVCRDPAYTETVQSMLQSMIRKRAHRITIERIFATAKAKHKDADVGQRGLERHMRVCVRPLYNRARGRKNG